MKRTITYISALFCLALCSCSLSKVDWVDMDSFATLDREKAFIPYSTSLSQMDESAICNSAMVGGGTVGDYLESESSQTKTSHTDGATLVKGLLSCWGSSKIRSYCGTYKSIDQKGKDVRLSGRIILPADGKVSRIMVVSHYTIGSNAEAPSNELPLEALYATRGLAVIEPDYIGYGITADRVHPYLCAELTATNVADMYFAALPFLKSIGCSPEYDDIFLLGYSQGGATTMSVAHYLDWNYPDVKIRLAMCGGGPYDICTTYDTLVDNDYTEYPCAIPMIIQGLDAGCSLNMDFSDFFLPRMVENMDEWLNSKRYTMAEITSMIGSKRLSSIMTDKARNKAEDIMTGLYKSMLDNSVVGFPIPECPLYLFHSFDDNVVPYENFVSLKNHLDYSNVIYNTGHYGGHVAGCLRFFLSCIDLLEKHGDI